MSYTEPTELEELQSTFSDFHKDFYGFRPRWASEEHWNSVEWLKAEIDGIHNIMDEMKKTPQGREQLRAQGWLVEEPFIEIED